MDSARRLSRWVTTNPVGAFTGTFAGLILLLLIGSIATHRLPGRAWLSVIEIFVPVSLCIGGAVWVQHSPWTSRIKPDWLSWGRARWAGIAVARGRHVLVCHPWELVRILAPTTRRDAVAGVKSRSILVRSCDRGCGRNLPKSMVGLLLRDRRSVAPHRSHDSRSLAANPSPPGRTGDSNHARDTVNQ
jgi:hypothetical protein